MKTKDIQTNKEVRDVLNTSYLLLLLKREAKADLQAWFCAIPDLLQVEYQS